MRGEREETAKAEHGEEVRLAMPKIAKRLNQRADGTLTCAFDEIWLGPHRASTRARACARVRGCPCGNLKGMRAGMCWRPVVS